MSVEAKLLKEIAVLNAQSLGTHGSKLIDDDAVHTGDFMAITALLDSTVDVSDCPLIANTIEDGDADFVIPKGVTIFGNFTQISIVSGGSILAYKKS